MAWAEAELKAVAMVGTMATEMDAQLVGTMVCVSVAVMVVLTAPWKVDLRDGMRASMWVVD